VVFSGSIDRGEKGKIASGTFFWRQSKAKARIKGSWVAYPAGSVPPLSENLGNPGEGGGTGNPAVQGNGGMSDPNMPGGSQGAPPGSGM